MKRKMLALGLVTAMIMAMGLTVNAASLTTAIRWDKDLGGSWYDYAQGIVAASDGGSVIAGSTYSDDGDVVDVNDDLGYSDAWIVKLDSTGAVSWKLSLGGTGNDDASAICATADGGFLVVGSTDSTDGDFAGNHGSTDGWAAKISSSGTVLWKVLLGTSGTDWFSSVQKTSDNGFILAGATCPTATSGSYYLGYDFDYWLVKLDASGNQTMAVTLGGTSYDDASQAVQTADGGYIVAGTSYSDDGDVTDSIGSGDAWLVKLNAAGSKTWAKSFGGSDADQAYSVSQQADGTYVVCGTSSSTDSYLADNHGGTDAWVFAVDSKGLMTWTHSLGGSGDDGASSVINAAEGGTMVAGSLTNAADDLDAWIIKLLADGQTDYDFTMGGSGDDVAYDLAQAADQGFFVASQSDSTDGDVTANQGYADVWVTRLNHILSPVTGLTATSAGYDRVKLTWNAATGASGYKIYQSTTLDGTYTRIKTITSGSTTSYTRTGLTPGTRYYYKIRALNDTGEFAAYSPYSAAVSAVPLPPAPANFTATRASNASIKLTWSKVTGADGYAVYRSTSADGTFTRVTYVTSGSTLTYTNTGLTDNKKYYYKIRAYCLVGTSKVGGPYTAVKSATP